MSDSYVNIFDPSRLLVEVHSELPPTQALLVGWSLFSAGSTPIGGPIACSPTVSNPCGNLRYGSGWKELFLLYGGVAFGLQRYWNGQSEIWHTISEPLPVLTPVELQEVRQEFGPWEVPHVGSATESTGGAMTETTVEVGGGFSAGGALSPEMPPFSIPPVSWVAGSQVTLTHKYDQYTGGSWCRFPDFHETRCFAPSGSLGGLVEGTMEFGALRIGPYKGVDEWVVHSIGKLSEDHGALLLVPKSEEE